MCNVNPRLKLWSRYLTAVILTVLLAGVSIVIYPEQKNFLYAEERPTVENVIKTTGQFVRSHKDLLKKSVESLKNLEQPTDQIAAWIEGVPLTVGELEFRKGLNKSLNPSFESHVVFNVLAEEKILLNEAIKRKVVPVSEEINEFLAKEKEEYKSNPNYRAAVDLLIKEWGLSEAEYWDDYEWYNAFRIIMIDKLYKAVIKEAEEAGLVPKSSGTSDADEMLEDQKAKESYWNHFKLELKRRANVQFNQNIPFLEEMKFDREKWYLS